MVKHTQTICWQFANKLFECVWLLWNMHLKGLGIILGRSAKIETLSKLFDFYINWKPITKGFWNGLIFEIWSSGSGDIGIWVL